MTELQTVQECMANLIIIMAVAYGALRLAAAGSHDPAGRRLAELARGEWD